MTKSHLIPLTLDVSAQFCREVIDMAITGYSPNWGEFDVTKRTEPDEHEITYPDRLRVDEFGDGDTPLSTCEIGTAEIAEGMRRVLLGDMTDKADHAQAAPHYAAAILHAIREGDTAHIDADTADVIMQAAALGRIVYA
ncbi:hypothetical protein BcepSauron_024 [Burkholderia phage BcepSauron]|uniref:Uncharacterized protein n=1 Tax=Burkholderia phage BcepSauron TaxID=2530033 RepID=A0A482MKV7_9CAUD|nr:hypothetical protein H1O17_gp024 [Burkholderia phage BcepSauron]QBQ74404.1 hypothetical protein BcepSauron_024 [Burkholderia phage BcepSauron]